MKTRILLMVLLACSLSCGISVVCAQTPDRRSMSSRSDQGAAYDAMRYRTGATTASTPGLASSDRTPTASDATDAIREEALQRAVWHSTEMLDARAYVLAYCERHQGMGREQGERYLQRVSQLSSAEMQAWLRRLQEKRTGLEGQRLAEEEAREWSLDRALERLNQMQQAGTNAQQAKARQSDEWQMRQAEMHAAGGTAPYGPATGWSAALAGQRLVFNPFAPSFDPASPPAAVAAAASLPGDLPRGDPMNFYRGDDRGGGGLSGAAVLEGAASAAPSAGGDAAAMGGAVEGAAGGGE